MNSIYVDLPVIIEMLPVPDGVFGTLGAVNVLPLATLVCIANTNSPSVWLEKYMLSDVDIFNPREVLALISPARTNLLKT